MAIDLDAVREEIKNNEVIYFPSSFNHLKDHCGFRPGILHVLIGPKGGGKSSLIKSWLLELLSQKRRVFLHLSEESTKQYLMAVVKALDSNVKNHDAIEEATQGLVVQSENSFDNQYQQKEMISSLEYDLRSAEAEILFIDNFTTSVMSRQGIGAEAEEITKLRALAEKLNIPVIIIAHTSKDYRNKEIAIGENVRGNMTISNTGAIIYTINSKLDHPEQPTVVLVDKSRYHSKAHKSYYRIQFDKTDGIYYQDTKISLETANNYWKEKKERKWAPKI